MNTTKKPRTWIIAKIDGNAESPEITSLIGPATAKYFSDDNYWINVVELSDYEQLQAENATLKKNYRWLIKHAWMGAAISKAKAAELLGCSLIDADVYLDSIKE